MVASHEPGTQVHLTVLHSRQTREAVVTLLALEDATNRGVASPQRRNGPDSKMPLGGDVVALACRDNLARQQVADVELPDVLDVFGEEPDDDVSIREHADGYAAPFPFLDDDQILDVLVAHKSRCLEHCIASSRRST
jgi:hypothetical protein